MIRPSALNLAQHCGLSAKLAADYPEEHAAAERGKGMHAEIAAWITAKTLPTSPQAAWACSWLRNLPDVQEVRAEVKLQLLDPETGDLITEGTADAIVTRPDGSLLIIDWKSGQSQYVPPPAENLQLAAYAVAAGLAANAPSVSWVLVFLDEQHTSDEVTANEGAWWPWLERLSRIASREPVAAPGEWCARCWSRQYCDAWKARVSTALTLLPNGQPLVLNDDTASALALRLADVKRAAEIAEEMVKAHVRSGGRVEADGKAYVASTAQGRRTADIKALEAAGLGQYVRQGNPYEVWKWRKI